MTNIFLLIFYFWVIESLLKQINLFTKKITIPLKGIVEKHITENIFHYRQVYTIFSIIYKK